MASRPLLTTAPERAPPGPTALTDSNPKLIIRKNPVASLGSLIALAVTPAHFLPGADGPNGAAVQSSGAISVRVQNIVTGQYLNNARVSVHGHALQLR